MENENDKKKILILRIVIIFIVLLLGMFLFVAIIDLTTTDKTPNFLGTTSRRTYTTTSSSSKVIVTQTPDITINSNTTINSNQQPNENNSTKKTTTKEIVTTKTSGDSSKTTSPIPVVPDYKAAEGSSKHPQSRDSWEWEIVSKINETRVKNGLTELIVAEELRTMAETAADKYYLENDDAVKRYLDGYNNYRLKSNNPGEISIDKLFNNTISSINIATNKYIKYVGVGVIYRESGWAGLPSYYYCIIYE